MIRCEQMGELAFFGQQKLKHEQKHREPGPAPTQALA